MLLFQVLTINVAIELFGMFFCLVCLCISALSPEAAGQNSAVIRDIRQLFSCDAFMLFSDAMAGIFRGKDGMTAFLMTHICNFTSYCSSFLFITLMIGLVTHFIPSESGKYFRRVAGGIVSVGIGLLVWNLYSRKLYYIDEYNLYTRGEWFPVTQITGIAAVIAGLVYLLRHWNQADPRIRLIFSLFAMLVTAALTAQIFVYGIAWVNVAVLIGLIVIFVYNQMVIAESLAKQQMIIVEQALTIEQVKTQMMLSQIKPHFLYNALGSIAQLCDESPDLAKETTIAFAKYLRGNMQSLEQIQPIPFADELSHIKSYLQIEKVRFGDLLHIEYDIQTEDFTVPCLTVQPLVENAVKHGVGQKPGGGTVRLATEENKDGYTITVRDDGVGFDTTEETSPKSLGIRNIRTRLRVSQAKLRIESKVGVGTTAVITIPRSNQIEKGESVCP